MTPEIRPNNHRKHFDRKTHSKHSAACTNRARLLEYERFARTHSFKLAEARSGGSGAAAAGSSGPSSSAGPGAVAGDGRPLRAPSGPGRPQRGWRCRVPRRQGDTSAPG